MCVCVCVFLCVCVCLFVCFLFAHSFVRVCVNASNPERSLTGVGGKGCYVKVIRND